MGTGWYRRPYYPDSVDMTATTALAAAMISEVEAGIADTGIRPGIIGEIGSDKAWVGAIEERVFRAAAKVQAKTGLGLMTHTPPGGALAQLEILVEAGAIHRESQLVIAMDSWTWTTTPRFASVAHFSRSTSSVSLCTRMRGEHTTSSS